MRFGISATSWIFPKNLRTRLRPVNVCAISSLALSNRRARDDSPEGRHPSRPSGQASGSRCLLRSGYRRTAASFVPPLGGDRDNSGVFHPGIIGFVIPSLLELHLGPGLLQDGLHLFGLLLGYVFLDRLWRPLDQVLRLLEAEPGERADLLDDVDLLLAERGKHDGELGFLLDRGGGRGPRSGGDGDRGRGRDAPLLFQ